MKWTDERIALLGTMSDSDLAARLGSKRSAVKAQRAMRKIAAYEPQADRGPKYSWDITSEALLGTMSDQSLARQMGITSAAVREKRLRMGVPAAKTVPKEWLPVEIAMLGTAGDQTVALTLGRSEGSVGAKRREMGIAAYRSTRAVVRRSAVGGPTEADVLAWPWAAAALAPQREFVLRALRESGLSRGELAAACCVGKSKVDQWAAPGMLVPMSMSLRRLVYLVAVTKGGI